MYCFKEFIDIVIMLGLCTLKRVVDGATLSKHWNGRQPLKQNYKHTSMCSCSAVVVKTHTGQARKGFFVSKVTALDRSLINNKRDSVPRSPGLALSHFACLMDSILDAGSTGTGIASTVGRVGVGVGDVGGEEQISRLYTKQFVNKKFRRSKKYERYEIPLV